MAQSRWSFQLPPAVLLGLNLRKSLAPAPGTLGVLTVSVATGALTSVLCAIVIPPSIATVKRPMSRRLLPKRLLIMMVFLLLRSYEKTVHSYWKVQDTYQGHCG